MRNRTLNKFKALRVKKAVKKVHHRKVRPNQIKKTLRVVPAKKVQSTTSKGAHTHQKQSKPPSPAGKHSPVAKIGARTISSLIGHRRLFLRNRRLMDIAHRPMLCAF